MKLRARLSADIVLKADPNATFPVMLDGEMVGTGRVLGATAAFLEIEVEVGDDSVAAAAIRAKTTAAAAEPEATLREDRCPACGGTKKEPEDITVQDSINVNGEQVFLPMSITTPCTDGYHRNPVGFA